jgi:endonuclease-3 related protein
VSRTAARKLPGVVYERLRTRFGHAAWWPGQTAFEVCVGAILVQNTAWPNVEKAWLRCVAGDCPTAGYGTWSAQIPPLIRSAGSFNVKARRLAAFVAFLGSEYGGRVAAMAADDAGTLRPSC